MNRPEIGGLDKGISAQEMRRNHRSVSVIFIAAHDEWDTRKRARFDRLLEQHHYLHSANLVGEQLRYLAACHGPWLALLSWNAAAFPLKDREAWIGWKPAQKRRRLSRVVNHSRS